MVELISKGSISAKSKEKNRVGKIINIIVEEKLKVSFDASEATYINKTNIPPRKIRKRM